MGSSDVHSLGVILYFDSTSYSSCLQLCRIIKFYGDKAKIAWIVHHAEEDDDGNVRGKEHIHVLITIPHGHISRDKFMRDFMISGHCCEEIYDYREFVRYMVHKTPNSAHKIQYGLDELHANFDITPIFNSKFNIDMPEGYIVLDIIEWAVKNDATMYQIGKYVLKKGYPWIKFRQNVNYILKTVEQEQYSLTGKLVQIL